MIIEREKEFDDGLFFGQVAEDQKRERERKHGVSQDSQKSLSLTHFAGLTIDPKKVDVDQVTQLSLKQFLVIQDQANMRFGHDDALNRKKRGLDEFSGSDQHGTSQMSDDENVELKMKKVFMKQFKSSENEFLTPGSLSWAMLIGLYLVTLHESSTKSVTFDSMRDMIEVMQSELVKVVSIRATTSELIANGPTVLSKFVE